MTLAQSEIDDLRAKLAKASKGPWEQDRVRNDGCYDYGEDTHEGFDDYAIVGADGKTLFDSINSDAGCIEVEYDEDGASAWDEVARNNAALIVSAINALPGLLDLASTAIAAREGAIRECANEAKYLAHSSEANYLAHSNVYNDYYRGFNSACKILEERLLSLIPTPEPK